MLTNELLLADAEEFCSLIINEEKNEEIDEAKDSLLEFLSSDVDGWTSERDDVLYRAVQCRVDEIWDLVSKKEKSTNFDLTDFYEDFVNRLSTQTGYEDGEDYGWSDEEQEAWDSENYMDSQEMMYGEDE